MLTWLVVLALLWPLFWVIRVLFVTRVLLGFEFRTQRVVALSPEEAPAHLREAAQPWVAQWEALGFRLLGAFRFERGQEQALDEFAVVLTHPEQPTRAVVQPHGLAARSGECWVSLRTTTAAGSEIVTASFAPEVLAPRPPGIAFEALPTESVAELLQRHRGRITDTAATAWRCVDLTGAAVREQYLCDGSFAHLRASGLVADRTEGSASFRLGPALGRAVHLVREGAKQQKAERKAAANRPPVALSAEALTTFDLQHYRQMIALQRTRLSLRAKTVLSIGSFLLFAVVLAWQMSPVVAVSLIVALVIHEGGHLLGMRWFGFRDTQLLFIPFFGGAAVGHDDKVLRPWQHIVIILLGPLPGLFAGIALLAYHSGGHAPEWLHQAALTAVVMNAFNLLPILPLDGGQIVDYALASRFPRVRVLFLAGSALGLLGVALLLDGVKLLLGVALLMVFRLPVEWKLARVRRELRAEFPEGGEEETIVRRLLARFRAPEWKKVTAANRLALARSLQHVLRMPRPGLGTMCFAVAGYTAPIWAGVPLALWSAHRKGEALVQRAEQNVRAAGLSLARPPAPAMTVAAAENGAELYAQAEALDDANKPVQGSPARTEERIELLRAAAHKTVFAPVATRPADAKGKLPWNLPAYGNGSLVLHLTTAAQERLRYREPEAALALAIDALRLIRLMDTAPGWWSWSTHQAAMKACWTVFEEVFASGAPLPPMVLAELRSLLDERHEIRFAAGVMARELLQEGRMMDELLAQDSAGFWLRFCVEVNRLSLGGAREQARTMNDAVALHQSLQEIENGKWPLLAGKAEESRALFSLVQLADQLARMRQARAAIFIAEARLRGVPARTFDALKIPPAELQHPLTREAMRWTRRGSMDVLAFASGFGRALGEHAGDADNEFVWRLSAQ